MKARKAYFRAFDHQLVQEAYPFTVKPKEEMKDQWDMLVLGDAVPAADAPLESIYPTKEHNPCEMKT
jgi:branched-chain amino acid transport system substrate-binding protein